MHTPLLPAHLGMPQYRPGERTRLGRARGGRQLEPHRYVVIRRARELLAKEVELLPSDKSIELRDRPALLKRLRRLAPRRRPPHGQDEGLPATSAHRGRAWTSECAPPICTPAARVRGIPGAGRPDHRPSAKGAPEARARCSPVDDSVGAESTHGHFDALCRLVREMARDVVHNTLNDARERVTLYVQRVVPGFGAPLRLVYSQVPDAGTDLHSILNARNSFEIFSNAASMLSWVKFSQTLGRTFDGNSQPTSFR